MRVWKWIDKICDICVNFRFFWRVPSLNGHNSARRGAIDPGPFSTARGFPADDLRHWKCLKSPFQAWLIRVQSSHTKGEFWAIFGWTSSFYWFSLFSLPLSRFWPISFEPPLENPRLRGTESFSDMRSAPAPAVDFGKGSNIRLWKFEFLLESYFELETQ